MAQRPFPSPGRRWPVALSSWVRVFSTCEQAEIAAPPSISARHSQQFPFRRLPEFGMTPRRVTPPVKLAQFDFVRVKRHQHHHAVNENAPGVGSRLFLRWKFNSYCHFLVGLKFAEVFPVHHGPCLLRQGVSFFRVAGHTKDLKVARLKLALVKTHSRRPVLPPVVIGSLWHDAIKRKILRCAAPDALAAHQGEQCVPRAPRPVLLPCSHRLPWLVDSLERGRQARPGLARQFLCSRLALSEPAQATRRIGTRAGRLQRGRTVTADR